MIDEFSWHLTLSEDKLVDYTNTNLKKTIIEQKEDDFSISPKINDKRVKKNTLEEDVKILIETYGELYPSKHIEIDLGSARNLLHRDRKRIDAFARLIKYLNKKYQTTLKITSRKTH